jgi:hypothetical protein
VAGRALADGGLVVNLPKAARGRSPSGMLAAALARGWLGTAAAKISSPGSAVPAASLTQA